MAVTYPGIPAELVKVLTETEGLVISVEPVPKNDQGYSCKVVIENESRPLREYHLLVSPMSKGYEILIPRPVIELHDKVISDGNHRVRRLNELIEKYEPPQAQVPGAPALVDKKVSLREITRTVFTDDTSGRLVQFGTTSHENGKTTTVEVVGDIKKEIKGAETTWRVEDYGELSMANGYVTFDIKNVPNIRKYHIGTYFSDLNKLA